MTPGGRILEPKATGIREDSDIDAFIYVARPRSIGLVDNVVHQFPGSAGRYIAQRGAPDRVIPDRVMVDHHGGEVANHLLHPSDAWDLARIDHDGQIRSVAQITCS